MFRICTICTLLIDPNRECIRIHSESSFHHNHRDLRLAQNRRLFQPQRSGTFTKVVASAIFLFLERITVKNKIYVFFIFIRKLVEHYRSSGHYPHTENHCIRQKPLNYLVHPPLKGYPQYWI